MSILIYGHSVKSCAGIQIFPLPYQTVSTLRKETVDYLTPRYY